MASNLTGHASQMPGYSDVVIKLQFEDQNRKFKLPLSDVSVETFSPKLRSILKVPTTHDLKVERYSDSAAAYIVLDSGEPNVYKQLFRAAKAKGKLRLRVTAVPLSQEKSRPVPVDDLTKALNSALKLNDKSLLAKTSCARPHGVWQVFCNACEDRLPDVHFHCSICDQGDYDLCERCVDEGKLCPGESHWLVKRFFKNGQPVNSTTERIAPRPRTASNKSMEMPGSFDVEPKMEAAISPAAAPSSGKPSKLDLVEKVVPRRTCNSCVRVLPEKLLVSCNECPDFDLCFPCLTENIHGHHPAHAFSAIDVNTALPDHIVAQMMPGRSTLHLALCDKCDKSIAGVRYKCLDCPDWDYCSDCYKSAEIEHSGHRFVPAFQQIKVTRQTVKHEGIYCDGDLCRSKVRQAYITGVRYKCTICHDTDFCAVCEAHPNAKHNKTHPLLKFKTPVDNVTITTIGEDTHNTSVKYMGDKSKADDRSITAHADGESSTWPIRHDAKPFDAVFEDDLIKDHSKLPTDQVFLQMWKLRNNGHRPWPVGTSVVYCGGDSMLNMDKTHPVDCTKLNAARFSTPTTDPIYPGRSHSFAVLLRTPPNEAHHISYWQLKTPEGLAFGHKMWVDIFTTKTEPTVAFLSGLPPSIRPLTLGLCRKMQEGPSRAAYPLRQGANSNRAPTPNAAVNAVASYYNTFMQQREQFLKAQDLMTGQINANKAVQSFGESFGSRREERGSSDISMDASKQTKQVSLPYRLMPQAIDQRIDQRHLGSHTAVNDVDSVRLRAASQRPTIDPAGLVAAVRPTPPTGDFHKLFDQMPAMPTSLNQKSQSLVANTSQPSPIVAQKDEPIIDNSINDTLVAPAVADMKDAEEENARTEDMKGSTMVFPTLEKESPSSSTHQDASSMHTAPSVAGSDAITTAPTVTEADTMTERNLDEIDFSDDEQGILTDDEYEILTASDTNI